MGNQRSCFDRLLQIPNGRLSGRHVLLTALNIPAHATCGARTCAR
jgi:hypothetical protein